MAGVGEGVSQVDASLLARCASTSQGLGGVENQEGVTLACSGSATEAETTATSSTGAVPTCADSTGAGATDSDKGAGSGILSGWVTKLSSARTSCAVGSAACPTSVSRSAARGTGCSSSATAVLFCTPASIAAAQASPENGAAGIFLKSEIPLWTFSCTSAASVKSAFSRVGVQCECLLPPASASSDAASRHPLPDAATSSSLDSSLPASRRHEGFASASSSSSSSSSSAVRQSRSNAGTAVTSLSSSSVSVPGVSSRLPKATGCWPASIFNAAGRAGASSTNDSVSNSGKAAVGLGAKFGLPPRDSEAAAGASTGTSGTAFAGTKPAWATPARTRADFTMEIKGSGGTKGFFKTPSAPTRCASCSSKGSNAPTSRITGMCLSAGSSLTYLQTS